MGNMWSSDPRGWRLSRRGFMKGATALAGTAALSSTLAGRNAGAQENTLTYLSWPATPTRLSSSLSSRSTA